MEVMDLDDEALSSPEIKKALDDGFFVVKACSAGSLWHHNLSRRMRDTFYHDGFVSFFKSDEPQEEFDRLAYICSPDRESGYRYFASISIDCDRWHEFVVHLSSFRVSQLPLSQSLVNNVLLKLFKSELTKDCRGVLCTDVFEESPPVEIKKYQPKPENLRPYYVETDMIAQEREGRFFRYGPDRMDNDVYQETYVIEIIGDPVRRIVRF